MLNASFMVSPGACSRGSENRRFSEPRLSECGGLDAYSSSIAHCLKKSCSSTPIGLLKKHARCASHADLAAALGQQRQPGQVEHQRGGQDRVAALPGELQRSSSCRGSPGSGCGPRPSSSRPATRCTRSTRASAACSRGSTPRTCVLGLRPSTPCWPGRRATRPSRLPRMLWPTQLSTRVAGGEHRRQDRLQQRLAGLAVLAAVRHACARRASSCSAGQRRAQRTA